jgi:hypothetical protein
MNDSSKACILCVSGARDVLAPAGTEFSAVLLITRASPNFDGKASICNPDNYITMLIPL